MTKKEDDRLVDEIMTIRDVAQYLRLSEAKVYELARDGTIPGMRIGKSWRFQKDLLKEWIRKCAEENSLLPDEQPGKEADER